MAIKYEYKCNKCDQIVAIFHSMNETMKGAKCNIEDCEGTLEQYIGSAPVVNIPAHHKGDYKAGR